MKQLSIKIPEELHKQLKAKLVIEGKTLTEWVTEAIYEYIE